MARKGRMHFMNETEIDLDLLENIKKQAALWVGQAMWARLSRKNVSGIFQRSHELNHMAEIRLDTIKVE